MLKLHLMTHDVYEDLLVVFNRVDPVPGGMYLCIRGSEVLPGRREPLRHEENELTR